MGPKKKEVFDENAWRTYITEAPLDEENWKVKVILFEAGGSEHERLYLSQFEAFAAEERRFVVKNICKTETIFMINQLGSEKKVKDDNLRVFEEAQAYLRDKKDIPPDILALVIKHLILKMKVEFLYISRQRHELKQGMARESAIMLDRAEVKGTVSARVADVPPPPVGKGKGKAGGDVPAETTENLEPKKYNTQLRVRGEEWRDKVYVDDYPIDGPNLYVALTGFVEPYLPGCLVKIGVPLTAVVQIRINPTTTSIPSNLTKATKRGQSLTELLGEQSMKFWEDLQALRIHKDFSHDYKNTAFIIFTPPYWDSQDLSGSPDIIYDELCYLMYDIQDLSRQHAHYLFNMNIMNIPLHVSNELYNKSYEQRIFDMPLECVTIYSVMDAILQTACNSPDLDDETSRTSLSTAVTLNTPNNKEVIAEENKLENSENLVENIFNTLCNTEASKKSYRITYGEEYEELREPTMIDYGDFAKYTTFQLGNINLDNIVFSALLGMPVNNLWRNQDRPSGENEAKINFHVNVLLSCFDRDDVETAELNRLMNILACRKLYNNRSSLKKRHLPLTTITEFKKKYLKRSIFAEPMPKNISVVTSGHNIMSLSFPSMTRSEKEYESAYSQTDTDSEVQRIKLLFECPDISELVTAAEIANNEPVKQNMIDDFDYFEDFSGNCAFQVMREAFNKFNCVDYKYCEVTDCFILMFFNSHDKEGMAREEWRCHLPTPVCLQDFFDYILEEHYDWIQYQEKIYDESVLTEALSVSKDLIDPNALVSCIETTDVDTDLLMEGSLKYQEKVQADGVAQESTVTVSPLSKTITPKSTEIDSKGTKKTKIGSSPKTVRPSFVNLEGQMSTEMLAKPFLGYDLGDRRVEIFGKDATYFSKDGTKVTSMYTLLIPMNLEYIILNVLPGNSNNEFWVHKALGDNVKPEIKDTCDSFRITCKDQVMIFIKKQMYQTPVTNDQDTENITTNVKKGEITSTSQKSALLVQTQIESYFHSLYVTWPNGMITETVYANNSPEISHIKQYYTCRTPNLDEEMRCISLNGEVIIYKSSGVVEVLKPDGSRIKIIQYHRRLIPDVEAAADSLLLDESFDKSKKGKSKSKLSKRSSKSSKMGVPEDEKTADEKPLEYEIVATEFETIETCGLRQRWVNDIPHTIEKLLIRTATDYCLGQVFSRRMDGTNTLLNKDGLLVVTFPDKTRIITSYNIDEEEIYPEWTDVEMEYFEMFEPEIVEDDGSKGSISQRSDVAASSSRTSVSRRLEEEETKEKQRTDGYVLIHLIYTIEHINLSTISINKAKETVTVESPNESTVIVDKNNNYDFKLDNETSANFDGEHLNISYEACSECSAFTNCNIKIIAKDDNNESEIKSENVWLKMLDSFNNQIVVNGEGAIFLSDEPSATEASHAESMANVDNEVKISNDTEEKELDIKSESSVVSHGKCRAMYLAKNIRFFILRRELTCAELLHRASLEEYKRACRWNPWCSINNHDTFGDHRSLVSILTPVSITESEKWLMCSKQSNKPKFMTYKDLKKDSNKGFYHWMRPYERFVPQPIKAEPILPERLPRAYVLRTVEQEWDESKRDELRGARELLRAVLRYRCILEADSETILNIPIIDNRLEDERRIDDIIQALAHKIYEELKIRIQDDIQSRAKASITTKPKPPEEQSMEGELEEEIMDETKNIEEERESLVKEAEAAEEMSPCLQRYWRRRSEEYKEEQFYKYLLREGSVPPYFHNLLGGAIWWDVNNATTEAVIHSERRKMKCVCADDDTTTESNATPFM